MFDSLTFHMRIESNFTKWFFDCIVILNSNQQVCLLGDVPEQSIGGLPPGGLFVGAQFVAEAGGQHGQAGHVCCRLVGKTLLLPHGRAPNHQVHKCLQTQHTLLRLTIKFMLRRSGGLLLAQ